MSENDLRALVRAYSALDNKQYNNSIKAMLIRISKRRELE